MSNSTFHATPNGVELGCGPLPPSRQVTGLGARRVDDQRCPKLVLAASDAIPNSQPGDRIPAHHGLDRLDVVERGASHGDRAVQQLDEQPSRVGHRCIEPAERRTRRRHAPALRVTGAGGTAEDAAALERPARSDPRRERRIEPAGHRHRNRVAQAGPAERHPTRQRPRRRPRTRAASGRARAPTRGDERGPPTAGSASHRAGCAGGSSWSRRRSRRDRRRWQPAPVAPPRTAAPRRRHRSRRRSGRSVLRRRPRRRAPASRRRPPRSEPAIRPGVEHHERPDHVAVVGCAGRVLGAKTPDGDGVEETIAPQPVRGSSSRSVVSARSSPSHCLIGTLKPSFDRFAQAAGSRRSATDLSRHFVRVPETLKAPGMRKASSATSRSRKGTRASSETAIEARSTFARMLSLR